MAIESITDATGSPTGLYGGRTSLQLFHDERFIASYQHHEIAKQWVGELRPGTFARACDALASTGFPALPPIPGLVPGDHPLELGWLRDGRWERGQSIDRTRFASISIISSSILSVLDSNLARMPPGETTPIVEHHRVDGGPDRVIDRITFGNQQLYTGRLDLQLNVDDTFIASHDFRRVRREWRGRLVAGTFARAHNGLANAGFPDAPPLGQLVPDEGVSTIRWRCDGRWQRALIKDESDVFSDFIAITSTILSVLDQALAQMPPGVTTPVIELHLA